MGNEVSQQQATAISSEIIQNAKSEAAITEALAKQGNHLGVITDKTMTTAKAEAIPKSRSAYSHFADYSFFPDRYDAPRIKASSEPPKEKHKASSTNQEQHPEEKKESAQTPVNVTPDKKPPGAHFSDFTLFPDRFNNIRRLSDTGGANMMAIPNPNMVASSLPNSSFLNKYNNRLRNSSSPDKEPIAQSIPEDSITQAVLKDENIRPRSFSNSKMYYFDFSLIPDKDPQNVYDQKKEQSQKRQRLYSMGDIPAAGGDPSNNRVQQQKVPEVKITTGDDSQPKTRTEAKFGFFDYSMIPDKDPRMFRRSNSKENDKKVAIKD